VNDMPNGGLRQKEREDVFIRVEPIAGKALVPIKLEQTVKDFNEAWSDKDYEKGLSLLRSALEKPNLSEAEKGFLTRLCLLSASYLELEKGAKYYELAEDFLTLGAKYDPARLVNVATFYEMRAEYEREKGDIETADSFTQKAIGARIKSGNYERAAEIAIDLNSPSLREKARNDFMDILEEKCEIMELSTVTQLVKSIVSLTDKEERTALVENKEERAKSEFLKRMEEIYLSTPLSSNADYRETFIKAFKAIDRQLLLTLTSDGLFTTMRGELAEAEARREAFLTMTSKERYQLSVKRDKLIKSSPALSFLMDFKRLVNNAGLANGGKGDLSLLPNKEQTKARFEEFSRSDDLLERAIGEFGILFYDTLERFPEPFNKMKVLRNMDSALQYIDDTNTGEKEDVISAVRRRTNEFTDLYAAR